MASRSDGRTLRFGGTFNPIHHGHLICARVAAEAAGFGHVTLIPNQQSPHKAGVAANVSAADRLTMCRLAVADDAGFAVDDLELARPAPSYTIDTVRQLKFDGDTRIHWLIGADQLAALPHWHRWDELLTEVAFVVMARPGWTTDWASLPPAVQKLRDAVVTTPLVQISSTDVRQRVADGRSVRYWVPPAVEDHIRRHRLYVADRDRTP